MTSCTVLNSDPRPRQTLKPFILLQHQSWHKPAAISSVALSGERHKASTNTPTPNDLGKRWRVAEEENKERVFFPLSCIPNLITQTWIYTLFEETKAAPAERSSCLSWTGKCFLYAHLSTPNFPKLRLCQAFALSDWPFCCVSSVDATLSRPVSQQLSTSTLKIYLSPETILWGIMLK